MLKRKAESELPGDKSSPKKHTKLSRQNISPEKFLCIVRSVQSTQHVKCSTCFLGLFCRPWRDIHRMTHQLEASHQLRKRDRKDAENFPFNGLWDAVFTAFGCNLSGDDFHLYYSQFFFLVHNIVLSAADHAKRLPHVFRKLWWRTIYTMLRIKLLRLKSDLLALWRALSWGSPHSPTNPCLIFLLSFFHTDCKF